MPPTDDRGLTSVRVRTVLLAAGIGAISACAPRQGASPPARSYTPRTRDITVTTVPLLVTEEKRVFPFLESAFAKGGVLEGKEVYAFSPSTIVVVEGDTVRLNILNPEDDEHSFVLPDLAVPLPGGKAATVTYVARRAGIYPILCAVQKHLPMMSGQLVVLTPTAMASSALSPAGGS